MKSLPPPDDAIDHSSSVEVIRGWVVGSELQISLAFEAFGDNAELWGQLLSDAASHIADAMSREGYGERKTIFERIQRGLLKNLEDPFTGLTGTIGDPVQ